MEKINEFIDGLKIETNIYNGGLCAYFVWNSNDYWADLCIVRFTGYTECMIFSAKNGEVTDWGELYCKRDISITPESLKMCIREFIEQLTEDGKENS